MKPTPLTLSPAQNSQAWCDSAQSPDASEYKIPDSPGPQSGPTVNRPFPSDKTDEKEEKRSTAASNTYADIARRKRPKRARQIQKDQAIMHSVANSNAQSAGNRDAMIERLQEANNEGYAAAVAEMEKKKKEEKKQEPCPTVELGDVCDANAPFPWAIYLTGAATALILRKVMPSWMAAVTAWGVSELIGTYAWRKLKHSLEDARMRLMDATKVRYDVPTCPPNGLIDEYMRIRWLERAFNPHCEIKREALRVGSEKLTVRDVDRAPFVRGAKCEPDPQDVGRFILVGNDEPARPVLANFDVFANVLAKLNCAERAEAVKIAQPLALRNGQLAIHKSQFEQVCAGSAEIACIANDQRRYLIREQPEGGNMLLRRLALGFSVPMCAATFSKFPIWRTLRRTLSVGHRLLACVADTKHLSTAMSLITLCGMAPFSEETFKSLAGIFIPRPSAAFGAFEYTLRVANNPAHALSGLLPFAFHAAIEPLPYGARLVAHSCYNLAALAYSDPKALIDLSERMKMQVTQTTASAPFKLTLLALGVTAVAGLAWAIWPRRKKIKPIEAPERLFGYRFGDSFAPSTPVQPHGDVEIKRHQNFDEQRPRACMAISLGPRIAGYAPCFPDRDHAPTVLHGVLNRFCRDPPPADYELLSEWHEFILEDLKRRPVISPDADTSVETWLASTLYPKWRQDQLYEMYSRQQFMLKPGDEKLNGFMKWEGYEKIADPRGINSREDAFKCAFGPYAKLMEEIIYQDKAFIKHVPVHERAKYIQDMLGHYPGPFYETDYTAFECHFIAIVMAVCEMTMYKHMLYHFPEVYDMVEKVLMGENVIRYKYFTLKIKARRMSGEMVTSLGNGYTNLMLARFVAKKSGVQYFDGVVEGDDGLFGGSGELDESLFKRLGFTIKILKHDDLLRSSFCGMMMSSDMTTFADPFVTLLHLGWSTSPAAFVSARARRGLLRAKALSLLYEHPACPMLSAVALRLIEETRDVSPRFTNSWYDAQLVVWIKSNAVQTMMRARAGPSDQARYDFFTIYGIAPAEQRWFEHYVGNEWDGGPLDHPVLNNLAAHHPNAFALAESSSQLTRRSASYD